MTLKLATTLAGHGITLRREEFVLDCVLSSDTDNYSQAKLVVKDRDKPRVKSSGGLDKTIQLTRCSPQATLREHYHLD